MEVTIQEAKKKDAAELIQFVHKVANETNFLTFSSSEFNKTVEEEEQIIQDHLLAKNQIFILAKLDGQIIGILNVQSSKKKRLEHIGHFGVSVLKQYWNKGVGSLLVQYMIDWAKESGIIRKLNLRVSVNNELAIRLYKKHGFTVEGIIKRDLKLNDKFEDTYQMGLLID